MWVSRSGSHLPEHKVEKGRQSIFNRPASKMPIEYSLFNVAVEVTLCRTRFDKIAVIYQDYYFHHNRKYKNVDYWCCSQRGCNVRLTSVYVNRETGEMKFSRRNTAFQHQHRPNAPNFIDKEFRRQLVIHLDSVVANSGEIQPATPASVYEECRRQVIKGGVPESLIPSFRCVRSTIYRYRQNNRKLLQTSRNLVFNKQNKENHLISMEEIDSPHPESSSLSCEESVCSDPEQTEPLCLVTRKNNNTSSDLQNRQQENFVQQTYM